MNNKKLLGKRIKEIRRAKGYTQESLSEAVGIDITTLSGIESGRHFPSLVTLEKIAAILNKPLVTLFDFNHFASVDEMKKTILKSVEIMSEDDIRFFYQFLNKKYNLDI